MPLTIHPIPQIHSLVFLIFHLHELEQSFISVAAALHWTYPTNPFDLFQNLCFNCNHNHHDFNDLIKWASAKLLQLWSLPSVPIIMLIMIIMMMIIMIIMIITLEPTKFRPFICLPPTYNLQRFLCSFVSLQTFHRHRHRHRHGHRHIVAFINERT